MSEVYYYLCLPIDSQSFEFKAMYFICFVAKVPCTWWVRMVNLWLSLDICLANLKIVMPFKMIHSKWKCNSGCWRFLFDSRCLTTTICLKVKELFLDRSPKKRSYLCSVNCLWALGQNSAPRCFFYWDYWLPSSEQTLRLQQNPLICW